MSRWHRVATADCRRCATWPSAWMCRFPRCSTPIRCLSTKDGCSRCPSRAISPKCPIRTFSHAVAVICFRTCSSMATHRGCWCSVAARRKPCNRLNPLCWASSVNCCVNIRAWPVRRSPVASWSCAPRWQHVTPVRRSCTGVPRTSTWRWMCARCWKPPWRPWSCTTARYW
ncbi:hypothetical protein D3C76_1132630 [compost metagenome]